MRGGEREIRAAFRSEKCLVSLLLGSDDLRMIWFAGAALFETQQWQSLFSRLSRGKISRGRNIARGDVDTPSHVDSPPATEDKSTARVLCTDACSAARMSIFAPAGGKRGDAKMKYTSVTVTFAVRGRKRVTIPREITRSYDLRFTATTWSARRHSRFSRRLRTRPLQLWYVERKDCPEK